MFVSPQTRKLKPNAQRDGVGGRSSGRCLAHLDAAPGNGNSAVINRARGSSPTPLPLEDTVRRKPSRDRKEESDSECARNLVLYFLAFRTLRNKWFPSKPLSLGYSATVA